MYVISIEESDVQKLEVRRIRCIEIGGKGEEQKKQGESMGGWTVVGEYIYIGESTEATMESSRNIGFF